ncbi:unnamed protein product [Lymnaea stagnalis]|uniref:Myosin motor domain-containing protein n=1 Tax=Lymnaea stagnalis TaxID=6523 RepID=A0AAV2ILD5_LYMST
MPKSKAKENLRTILDNLSNDEVSTAQRNAAGWMPSGIADSISRSLKSFHSSDESDKNDDASSDLEPESIYYDIENVLDPLGVSQRGESDKDHKDESEMYRHTGRPGDKGSPAAQNSNATYATPFRPDLNSRTTIQGVDNFAFENTEFRPPAVNRSTSLAPDYNDDDPPEDYGSSERLVKDPFSMPTNPNSSTKKVNFGFSLLPGGGHPGQTSNKYPNSHIPLNEMLGFSQGRSRLGRNSQTTTIVESDPSKVSDLSKLPELTLDTITRCIKERYFHDKIYTYCGEILISVNPFKPLELCTSIHYDEYRYSQISQTPHLYAISARAYSGIRDLEQDQVILVSGESGAGKTEATKLMVQHLMHIGGTEYDTLQDKIIKINPLLEAFGNAKTILNNNSSRFAKFLALSVNKEGKIESARVKDYMIERSRIVHHNPKERTFHAFYALLVGAPDDLLDSLYINRRDTFRITGEFYALNGKEKDLYKHIYQSQQDVFQLIKLTADEILDVNTILAAVLHLGNVEFVESENDCVSIKNETYVQQAAFLLQMDAMNLTKVLIERKGRLGKDRQVVPVIMSFSGSGESSLRTASRGKSYQSDLSSQNSPSLNDDEVSQSGEIILLSKNKKQAEDERDAIAKALYERMFGWLVRKVNDSLKSVKYRNLPSIGILDICGFENLEINSFEQLCINLVNEHLQNFMNKQAIEDERLLYVDEGIEISDVDVKGINNDAILSLFMERKAGILAMIDEDSKIEFSNDEKMVAKFKMLYGSSPIFVAATNDVPMFSIQHFAGKVPYDARSFIQKNRDTLSEDSVECLKTSESTLIQDLFTVTESITGSISLAQYNFRGSRRPNTKRPVFTEVNLSQSINQSRNVSLRQKFGDKPPSFKQGDRAKQNTHIT